MVEKRATRPRNAFQAYYTESEEIVSYMVSKLCPTAEDNIWEPCAGAGHLVDGILASCSFNRIRISEINPDSVGLLQEKYANLSAVELHREDALEVGYASLFEGTPGFTRIIANPPYGGYQTPERRAFLKKKYPKLYVKETYGLILYHSLQIAEKLARIVFIVPDTFLWLHRHEFLRRTILQESTVEEIVLFPSRFFPGVSFGYSGLCIITLIKKPPADDHSFLMIENLSSPNDLFSLSAKGSNLVSGTLSSINQISLLDRTHAEFEKAEISFIGSLSDRVSLTLSDIAEVRTGFYSGNDRRWIRRANEDVPRSGNYEDIEFSRIASMVRPPLDGITNEAYYIPIIRGGSGRFVRPTNWFVDWSVEAVSTYRRAGKNPARFQNAGFYFKEGIAVPMIASGQISAALIEGRLFDQAVVGIFPNEDRYLLYILGFLNTSIATSLLRSINPTANNSANYLKRLPIALPSETELKECNELVSEAISQMKLQANVKNECVQQIEDLFQRIYLDSLKKRAG